MTNPEFPAAFVQPWLQLLKDHQEEQIGDFPNYYVHDPQSLITDSIPRSLYLGTGYNTFRSCIIPAVLSAKQSVYFVTCYWAESPTSKILAKAIEQAATTRRNDPNLQSLPPLVITIGFSSKGLFQKLFHTSSRDGQIYPPSAWPSLGLPRQTTLTEANISLTVKSLFFTPFSVMHPKYVIIDSTRAMVPSCNVSWEAWFEGCVEVEGGVVKELLRFHQNVWGTGAEHVGNRRSADESVPLQSHLISDAQEEEDEVERERQLPITSDTVLEGSPNIMTRLPYQASIPTIFLPSPHHRNPRLSFLFPFFSRSNPPITPLNAALLTLLDTAQSTIVVTTPNVTSQPAVEAILGALTRGVDVTIRTCKHMMMVEQLVTAGTTTAWCLRSLIKRYQTLVENWEERRQDIESQSVGPGKLQIYYYKPFGWRREKADEPSLSHFKMTLVDNEYLVLGSGNMDRASWWTSQEIGILFHVPGFSGDDLWDPILQPRSETLFSSHPVREEEGTEGSIPPLQPYRLDLD